jgi:citrate lyase beta subunit
MDEHAWNAVIAAVGADVKQAEAEVDVRGKALQRINPDATRDAAARQLVWDYAPRPIEHIFPGDNWYFLIKAVQSGAHILLLDLEDSIAANRKDVARTVLTLLVRAFRGHSLTEEDLTFVKTHALPTEKADHLEQKFVRDGGMFRLTPQCRFRDEQMILVRPNSLRTKWAAADYFDVVWEIGDLIAGIFLPKVEGPEDVQVAIEILRALQRERGWVIGGHKVYVQTELPGSILKANEILAVAPEVEEVNLGIVDYTAATGARSVVQQEQYTYMRYPLLKLVEAARAKGKAAGTGITVTLNADDTEADTVRAIALGIHRKTSVHPTHIEGIGRHATRFPSVVRKHLPYPEIASFDLAWLERLAREEQPILPPVAFDPRPVTLCRSVVTVRGNDLNGLRAGFASPADMVIVDMEGLEAPDWRETQQQLSHLSHEVSRHSQMLAFQVDVAKPQGLELLQDLLQFFQERVQTVILPSVDGPRAVRHAAGLLSGVEREIGLPIGSLTLGARLASPDAIEREAYAIATASQRMMWLFLDLPGAQPKEDPADPITKGYYYYRSALVAATAAADVDAVDGMSDAGQFEEEALFAANLGFQGKQVAPQQAARVNAIMSPPQAGERPTLQKGPTADAFRARWINSVERALEVLELYAAAELDRNLGAVAYSDPVTGQREMVDAATVRIYYRQLERALKAAQLTDAEAARYGGIPALWSGQASPETVAVRPTPVEEDRDGVVTPQRHVLAAPLSGDVRSAAYREAVP